MIDVGGKRVTRREAIAAGSITMSLRAFDAIRSGSIAKGDVGAVARIAGIAAAKRTADLVPLCHPVPLDDVSLEIRLDRPARAVRVEACARTRWSTGVEMEALVAVTAALLTVYDMAKALDRAMEIGEVRLLRKSGGRSGLFRRGTAPVRARRRRSSR